jgi:RNA polymerase sigma-70 factor (ECF subfamily)
LEQRLINIIEGCKKSKPADQEQLYKLFYNYGLTICSRYAYSRDEAKEMFNDAFVKIFRNIDRYQFKGAFKSWIHPIFVNSAIDYYRKYYARKGEVPLSLDAAAEASVKMDVISNLDYKTLLALIRQLPPVYGMVFNLAVVEGYKHSEIAEMLNISEGTSKSNLSRAKSKMKAMILTQNLVTE